MGEPERTTPRLSDQELVDAYLVGGVEGCEVMLRLLEKIGLGERAAERLVRQDGSPLTSPEGEELAVADYLKVAGQHPGAVPAILRVVAMGENDPMFPAVQGAVASMVNGYLLPTET